MYKITAAATSIVASSLMQASTAMAAADDNDCGCDDAALGLKVFTGILLATAGAAITFAARVTLETYRRPTKIQAMSKEDENYCNQVDEILLVEYTGSGSEERPLYHRTEKGLKDSILIMCGTISHKYPQNPIEENISRYKTADGLKSAINLMCGTILQKRPRIFNHIENKSTLFYNSPLGLSPKVRIEKCRLMLGEGSVSADQSNYMINISNPLEDYIKYTNFHSLFKQQDEKYNAILANREKAKYKLANTIAIEAYDAKQAHAKEMATQREEYIAIKQKLDIKSDKLDECNEKLDKCKVARIKEITTKEVYRG